MKKQFKYPTIKTFFDADKVACVFTKEAIKMFTGIQCLPNFFKKTWEINEVNVMAVRDLEVFICKLINKKKYNFIHYDKKHLMNVINGSIYLIETGEWVGTD